MNNFFKNFSIKWKIVVVTMLAVAAALLMQMLILAPLEASNARRNMAEKLEAVCRIAALNSTAALVFDDEPAAAEILSAVSGEPHVQLTCIHTQDGKLFVEKGRHEQSHQAGAEHPVGSFEGSRYGPDRLHVMTPIRHEGEALGFVYVEAGLEGIQAQVSSIILVSFVVLLVCTAAGFIFSLKLQRIISRPVLELAKRTREVSKRKDYSLRATKESNDEVGQLVEGFNEMLATIEERDEVLSASHDQLEERVLERTQELADEFAVRQKAEESLRLREKQYRDLVETSTDLIWSVDAEGRWTFVNQAVKTIYGYEPEEMIGRPFTDFLTAEQAEKDRREFAAIKAGKQTFLYQTEHLRKDGLPVKLRFNAVAVTDVNGKVLGTRGTATDVTDMHESAEREKELQSRLVRAQRMESLGLLAGGVAHDLNNMLGPLVGYPDIILDELPGDSSVRNDLIEMRESAKRAAAVIQDLLNLARRGMYKTTPVNVTDIVDAYLHSPPFRELKARNPLIMLELDHDQSMLKMRGSVPHLTQVIMNLVANACEVMTHGGTLTISTFVTYIDYLIGGYDAIEEGDYVVICVGDTGGGIEPEHEEHIFEPFYTTKKMGKSGSGLGLAVVYGVVKDLNGYIDIENRLGEGVTFKLYFPVDRTGGEPKKTLSKDFRGSERVLVVDDVREQRVIATRMLTKAGYQVETAIHGHDALRILEDRSFDLIVLDMVMEEGFDGLDTYREIVKMDPHPRCIIASGFSENERVNEAYALGAGAYVRKPYTLDKIAGAVRAELDSPKPQGSTSSVNG